MRYVMQAVVMAGDVLLFVAVGYAVFKFSIIGILIAIPALRAWKNSGGFSAWRPSCIRQFLANAKACGL